MSWKSITHNPHSILHNPIAHPPAVELGLPQPLSH